MPLALPATHSFWTSEEAALPQLPDTVVQAGPGFIVCRDGNHVFALNAGVSSPGQHRHAPEKYGKFCYSTCFGFAIASAPRSLASCGNDSMLALSVDGEYFRVRTKSDRTELSAGSIIADWQPWPGVSITTWLIPVLPWHVRVHVIRSAVALVAAEGGFSLAGEGEDSGSDDPLTPAQPGLAVAMTLAVTSVIRDLYGGRTPRLVAADPNTNILYPRSVIPTLMGELLPGENWLACAVVGRTPPVRLTEIVKSSPLFRLTRDSFTVTDAAAHQSVSFERLA